MEDGIPLAAGAAPAWRSEERYRTVGAGHRSLHTDQASEEHSPAAGGTAECTASHRGPCTHRRGQLHGRRSSCREASGTAGEACGCRAGTAVAAGPVVVKGPGHSAGAVPEVPVELAAGGSLEPAGELGTAAEARTAVVRAAASEEHCVGTPVTNAGNREGKWHQQAFRRTYLCWHQLRIPHYRCGTAAPRSC